MRHNSVLLIAGVGLFLTGVIMVILKAMIGILVLLVGFALIAVFAASMFRTGGYRAEGAFFNGFGQGRQQSEVSKRSDPSQGEQNAGIWETMTDAGENK